MRTTGVLFGFIILQLLVFSCESNAVKKVDYRAIATDYFATFAARKDWARLQSFYADTLHFEDVMLQEQFDKAGFLNFYDWDRPDFRKLFEEQEHLKVEELLVEGQVVIARGQLQSFYYQEELIDLSKGCHFAIWLYFDENGKIIKQIDWFEYWPEAWESVARRMRQAAETE